jgi:hypothetical protein
MARLSSEQVCTDLAARLRSRKGEMVTAVMARIRNISSEAPGNGDMQYEEGQREAVVAALEYAITGIEQGEARTQPIPTETITQAHRATRNGVELGTVLRRYYAASAELTDFLTYEAYCGGLLNEGEAFRSVQKIQAALLDRLVITINEEYMREGKRVARSPEMRRAERVRRLLSSGLVESNDLGYDLDRWHLGIIGRGMGVGQAIRGISAGVDCQILSVEYDEQVLWAWLGGRQDSVVGDIRRLLSFKWPTGVLLAFGEPLNGIEGWRHTHRQAQDASLVSRYQPQTFTSFADVALLVPWLRDETRAQWLVDTYLSPLDSYGRSGRKLRETLRAYFASGRNASLTGATLKVTRRTIHNRIHLIEQNLGPLLDERQAELELALRLDNLRQTRVEKHDGE